MALHLLSLGLSVHRTVPAVSPRAGAVRMGYTRSSDLLGTGPSVSDREVVNVLGRWKTYTQWNDRIGALAALDKMDVMSPWSELVVDGKTGKLRRPANEEEKEMRTPARSPQRRAWCQKRGLAQRYWHNANVGLLPFRDEAMARSVGATASQLNREPISRLACDVVFDAVSDGQARHSQKRKMPPHPALRAPHSLCAQGGIVEFGLCDERRATYQRPDGAFDAQAFGDGVGQAKRTVAIGYAIYPGILNVIFAYVGYRIDAYHLILDAAGDFATGISTSWASTGAASLAAPLILAVGYIYGIRMKPAPTVDAAATDVRYQIGERTARLKK